MVCSSSAARCASQYVSIGIPQVIEVVEDRKLHVGVDAMDERNPAVGKVEQHGVLVLDTVGTQQPAAVGIEVESLTVVDQQVGADPPRLVGIGREIGVRHHDVVAAGIPDDLDPGVLEAVDAMVTGAGEDVGELVRHAVVRLGRRRCRTRSPGIAVPDRR